MVKQNKKKASHISQFPLVLLITQYGKTKQEKGITYFTISTSPAYHTVGKTKQEKGITYFTISTSPAHYTVL